MKVARKLSLPASITWRKRLALPSASDLDVHIIFTACYNSSLAETLVAAGQQRTGLSALAMLSPPYPLALDHSNDRRKILQSHLLWSLRCRADSSASSAEMTPLHTRLG